MKHFIASRMAIAVLATCASYALPAYSQTPPPQPGDATQTPTLKEVIVTGNPLGASDLVLPVNQISGTSLLLRSQSTLGETLANMPGVSSTYFGPNTSRPIIRGQDGDRIRILQNGGASVDASALSFDHAVPADVMSAERIEVLRGPGALLYGGSAVGGVVNVIDSRIPRERLFDAKGGVTGKVDFGLSSADRAKNSAFLVETGTDKYTLHVDAFARSSDDVAVPVALACTKPGSPAVARRICNSANDSKGASLGGSLLFDRGYVGASFTGYGSHYGTVAEDEVTIDMRSRRTALEAEIRGLSGLLQSVKAQFGHTDYQHTEFEGATAGTVFANKGNDLRVQAKHTRWGGVDGVWGLQVDNNRFSADGAEAFAPYSRSRNTAVFGYEEMGMPWGKLTAGARLERAKVQSQGNPALPKFIPGERNFTLGSYALGGAWNVAKGWQLTSNLSVSQRAPKDYELFADGPHIATGAYEVGDATLAKEKSTNLDVGMKWEQGKTKWAVSAFVSRFKNYTYLDSSAGNLRGADGELNPVDADGNNVADVSGVNILTEFNYRQVKARFTGLEVSGAMRLLDGGQTVDLEWRADMVRGQNLSAAQALPRIAPVRLGSTLVVGQGPWSARLGFDSAAKQTRVPTGQLAVSGYTLWNAALTYRMRLAAPVGGQIFWFARLDNLTNQLAYSATSILTQTAAGKAPLPGRSVKLGLQASF